MSVNAPKGFVAAGGSIGVKQSGAFDCAIVASETGNPVFAAGVFTKNLVAAAPVQISRAHLLATAGKSSGVIITSGNANAATGEPGVLAASRLCDVTAKSIGCKSEEILICQTGLIGLDFPIDKVEGAVASVVNKRASTPQASQDAAEAIMTTDTFAKQSIVAGDGFSVGGMAKGAAMLEPNMATMLCILTTDAPVWSAGALHEILLAAVSGSFNEMTVDGCMSTNDTVLLFSSGLARSTKNAGSPKIGDALLDQVAISVAQATKELCEQMVVDAEGGSKVFYVRVTGALSIEDAKRAAKKIANSLLVKCSVNGQDPYWGRIASELGASGAQIDPDRIAISYGTTTVVRGGVGISHDQKAVLDHLVGQDIEINCTLGLGDATGTALGCDLGYGYIDENKTTS